MFENLNATVQRVRFRAVEPLTLPEYKGSTFRGALGHAFRQVACALRRQECDGCMLRERCAYSVCFETPVPAATTVMRKYTKAPHPFVLEPPPDTRRDFEPGEELVATLILVGRAQEHLAHFIYAFDEMARNGLGIQRRKAELLGLDAAWPPGNTQPIYNAAEERLLGTPKPVQCEDIQSRVRELHGKPLRLTFETPVRINLDGRLSKSAEMAALLPSLLRRLSLLNYFHCGASFETDVRPLLDSGRDVKNLRSKIFWKDWTRYSTRQETLMEFGGFIGWAEYPPLPDELLQALAWGEILHLGKASAFGLGKYNIAPQSVPALS